MKAALISRHELLPAQKLAIEKAGIEILKTVPQVPVNETELHKFINELKSQGIQAIVTTGLPPHLIAQLQQHFTIYVLKMQAIATVENREEAEKLLKEKPEKRIILQGRIGEKESYRIMEFVGLYKVKVQIHEEPVVVI